MHPTQDMLPVINSRGSPGRLHKLKTYPAFLYEEKQISIGGYTFTGLIPPPVSGDRLELCVGCERCRRVYHQGTSYSLPTFPPDFKLRGECVGDDGSPVWFRPDATGERVEIEYEACSMPDDKCTVVWSRTAALICLRDIRTGRRKTAACPRHVHDRACLTAAAVTRARGNGNGQKNRGSNSKPQGRPPVDTSARGHLRPSAGALSKKSNLTLKAAEPSGRRELLSVNTVDMKCAPSVQKLVARGCVKGRSPRALPEATALGPLVTCYYGAEH